MFVPAALNTTDLYRLPAQPAEWGKPTGSAQRGEPNQQASQVDPAAPAHPAQPSGGKPPIPSANLLSLVRDLITFGRHLARLLGSAPGFDALNEVVHVFRTPDFGQIMLRIVRALRTAEALEQRILRNARQLDNPRFRFYIPRRRTTPAQPEPTPQAAPEPAALALQREQDPLSSLPTVEEIAARIRHRPIGAVLADICCDLGINGGYSKWHQLCFAIVAHRGNLPRFLENALPDPRRRRAPAARSLPSPTTPPVSTTPPASAPPGANPAPAPAPAPAPVTTRFTRAPGVNPSDPTPATGPP